MEFLMHELEHSTFWVAVALLIFFVIVAMVGAPGMIVRSLDQRSAAIKREIEEARRLKEEAQALLASYQRKAREAESEAEGIIAQARHEAELLKKETIEAMEELAERRTRLAEIKISQAEANAIKEVRATAAAVAISAAQTVLRDTMTDAQGNALIDNALGELGSKLH